MTPPRLWPTVVASGTLGVIAGACRSPTWQDVIEPAQVLAGLVSYPPDNPVYLYSVSTWTLLHQLTALPLAAGISEWSLTIAISGLVGALSFIALALTARAMGAPALLAACCPLLIHAAGLTRFLPGYPVLLLGWPYTYGIVSHALLLMLLALVGLRRDRAAALLLGMFPAIHPGVGLWAWIMVAALVALDRHQLWPRVRDARRWALAGLLVAASSAAVHWSLFAPGAAAAPDPALLRAVRLYWDGHRLPLAVTNPDVLTALLVPVVLLAWHRRLGTRVPAESRTLTLGLLVGVAIAAAADLAIRVTPDPLSALIARPMPSRLLVLPLMAIWPWTIGALCGTASSAPLRTVARWAYAAVAIAVIPAVGPWPGAGEILWAITPSTARWIEPVWVLLGVITTGVIAAAWAPPRVSAWITAGPARLAPRVLAVALGLSVTMHLVVAASDRRSAFAAIADRQTDAALASAAARPGLLAIAADLHLIQAATRRPLLVDPGAIDALPYVPGAVAVTNRILRSVYDVALDAPPDLAPTDGVVPHEHPGRVWQHRSVSEWQVIGRQFGVTDVLTFSDLELRLPVIARSAVFTLWSIPER